MDSRRDLYRAGNSQQYRALFVAWSERIERWIRRALLVLVILLVIFQSLLRIPSVRPYLTTVDKLEGTMWEPV